MANYFSQIPELNNIQFVPDEVTLPSDYHILPYFQEWFKDHIREWQYDTPYYQKIQQGDKQYLVLKRTQFNDVHFEIYSCDGVRQILRPAETGEAKYRYPAQFVIEDSGDVYQLPDGTNEPLIYHQWQFRFSDFNLSAGTYYVFIPVYYFDGITIVETRAWISEPIILATDHPDTILVEYYNENNTDDIIFKYDMSDNEGFRGGQFFSPKFGLRIEGDVINPKVASSDTSLKEQDYEPRLLNSFRWDTYEVYIGNDKGVPFYMLSKMNKIFGCDYKAVDGVRYEKDDGFEWNVDEVSTYPLFCADLQVQLYDKRDKISDTRGQIITFAELNGTYPAAIFQTGLGYIGAGVVLNDNTDRTNYISDLNNSILEQYGLNGTAVLNGTNIDYQSATGENIVRFEPQTTYEYTTFTADVTAGENMTFEFINFKGVIDWDTAIYTGYGAKYQQAFQVFGTAQTRRYTYGSNGTYDIRVFHFPTSEEIYITKGTGTSFFNCDITDITGDVPQGLKVFFVMGATLGAFSLDFLAVARQNINEITIRNSGITGFSTNVFSDYSSIGIGGNSANWSRLNIVNIFQNGLSQTEQETFINDFYDHAPHVIVGTFITRQSPANTISDASAVAAIASLQGAGWSTIT